LGFRVGGLDVRVHLGFRFGVWGSGSNVEGLGSRVEGLGLRIAGLVFRV